MPLKAAFSPTTLGTRQLIAGKVCFLCYQTYGYMKYLLWLLLPVSAVAQQEPPKGTNTIVIATTLSGSLLYRIAGQVLMQNGYTMSRFDKDSLHIQTQIRKLKDVAIYPGLTIAISEGKAISKKFHLWLLTYFGELLAG